MNSINFCHNNKNYSIKKINEENILEIFDLCKRSSSFFEAHEGRYPCEESVKEILYELPEGYSYEQKHLFGVYDNNFMVSIIDFLQDYPEKKETIIGLLLISPEYRNQGLGKKIHEIIIKISKDFFNAEKLRIGVVKDNITGVKFWTSLGYKKLKEVEMILGSKNNTVIIMNLETV